MNDQIEFRQISESLRKYRWWVIIAVTIGLMLGYMVSLSLPKVYEASTTIAVSQSIQTNSLSRDDIAAGELLARTYATLVRRQPILEGVVEELELDFGWKQLRNRVGVNVIQDTQLIEISVEAESPEAAEMLADELAHQAISLDLSSSGEQENRQSYIFAQQQLEVIQTRINDGRERLNELREQLLETNSTIRLNDLQAEISTLERLITDWERSYLDILTILENNQSPNNLILIEPAQANSNPIRPRILLNTIIGGIAGLVLSLGVIFLLLVRESYDDSFETTKEVDRFLEIGSLGGVGRLKGRNYPDKLITEKSLLSPIADSYRLIHNNIEFITSEEPVHTLLITSPGLSEGKSITAANLGIIMANSNLKTIIVDAHLRSPSQHQIFQIPNTGGLAELLSTSELNPEDYLRNTHLDKLQVINSGNVSPTSLELMRSPRMKQLLSKLSSMADIILLDSPPVVALSDGLLLSKIVDGVVLMVDSERTRRDLAQRAITNLNMAGANILGAVLNRANQLNT